MHELVELKNVVEETLLPAGFSVEREESHPDAFGSFFCIYARGGHQIRFVWDGKDGCGFLEHRRGDSESWEVVGAPIGERSVSAMREEAMAKWPNALASLLAGLGPVE